MSCITIISCLCLALIVGACATEETSRIANGENANIIDFPYQVSMRKYGKHNCGGAIISKRHILTAAHCVHDGEELETPLEHVSILAGSTLSTGNDGKRYYPKKVAVHEDWTNNQAESFRDDIALVTLTEDIEFDEYTKTIELPQEDVAPGAKVVVTGWGLGSSFRPMVILQKTNMTIVPIDECQKTMPLTPLFPGQLCAYQKKGVGVCTADSGGPLAAGNVVVGIVSMGLGACDGGYPDVYASTYYYKDWIVKNMGN